MKYKKVRWIPPVLWMSVIFYFSHQPGDESSQMSGRFAHLLNSIIHILNLDSTGWNLQLLVRKAAHFTEFAVLGLLLFIAVYSKGKKLLFTFVTALTAGALYGVFDELHQIFIPGRSCQIRDMLIDAGGVLFAVLLCSGYALLKKYLDAVFFNQ